MGFVVVEQADECCRIRLSNGDANPLTIDVVDELAAALGSAEGSARAVLLCGGDRFFCNGLDLGWALSRSPDELRGMFLALGRLVLRMLECPLPLVAAFRGHAIGAGKTLVSACDVRLAARGRVLLGMPEILLGVPNPYFADQLVRHLIGDVAASDMIYGGRLVAAESCVGNGLVHEVLDRNEVEERGWQKALELGALPSLAFAESKSMRVEALCRRIRGGLEERTDRLIAAWYGAEAQQRLQAAARRLAR